MPGLYGFSGNANTSVNVGNTIGLYQQNTGNVAVVNNAQTLFRTLSQSGNVNFALTNGNTQVLAYTANIGTAPGTYGNVDYYPVLSVTSDGRVTAISTVSVASATGGYGNANVAAFLPTYTGQLNPSTITAGNIITTAGVYWSNGQPYSSGTGTGTYSNVNVAAYIGSNTDPTISSLNANTQQQQAQINSKANIAGQVFTGNVQAPYFIGDGSALTGLPSGTVTLVGNVTGSGQTGTNINTTISASGVTPGIYGSAGVIPTITVGLDGRITQISTNAASGGSYSNTNVTALLSSNTVSTITTTGNITAGGNIITPGTFYGNLIAANILVANIGIQQYTNYQTPTTPAYSKGILWYDNVSDALAYYNGVTNNTVHIGQETQFQAYNGTASTITQGTPVYITGGSFNTFPNVAPAQANTLTTTVVAGVANQNIPAGTNGYVVTEGTVANVSVGTFSTGDTLYLSPYSAGQVQKTVPATGYVAIVGVVTYANSPNGRLLVRITNPTNNQTFGNISVTGNITTGNISSTNGYFWANGTAYSTGSTSTYSNTNVAAYLTTATISTTGNITAGNLIATSYVSGDGSKLTNLPVQAGTYSNANVAAYLPTYSGTMQANSHVATRNNITDSTTTGAYSLGALTQADTGVMAALQTSTNGYAYLGLQNTNSGTLATTDVAFYNDTANLGVYIDVGINSTGYTGTGSLNKANTGYVYTGNADLSIGTYYNNPIHFVVNNGATDAMTIATNNTVLVSNIASSNGYFWANGTAYSTGGGGGSGFSGDLAGNTLTASGTGRILANAYPQSNVTQIGSYTQAVVVNTLPSYTGANLNSQNQTVSMATLANINFLTTFANSTTRTTNAMTAYLGATATSSNISMNPSDRIRAMSGALDLNLNGKYWGSLNSTSNLQFPVVINGQTMNIYGTGQIGQATGISDAITFVPVNGSISAQYATAYNGVLSYSTAGGGSTASNIQYARLYTGTVAGVAGNLTVNNAIALHTYSGWVSSNVSLVTNAYAVLNEDTRTAIQTAGNLNFSTGNLSTINNSSTGNVTVYAGSKYIDMSVNTGGLGIPIGGNSTRPATPAPGTVRFNTDIGNPEWYNAATSSWSLFNQVFSPYQLTYLIVAGGGGASSSDGGGAGGGGVVSGSFNATVGTTYTVTVGAGGSGQAYATPGSNGSNSSLTGVTTAVGGGGGGQGGGNGQPGGSGGGSGQGGSGGTGGSGTSGQGFAGGNAAADGTNYCAAGGGGAGAVGGAYVSGTVAGSGGAGISSSITGSAVSYAGGGGGGALGAGTPGSGGSGGGGAGSATTATNGTANTGGGAGGGGPGGVAGANGGSGVVILSVPTSLYSGTTTGSPTITTSGSNTIMTFTSSGSYTG